MKVKELIEILSELDQEKEITLVNEELGHGSINIKSVNYCEVDNDYFIEGE